jgi:CheY-like chemotaxis protein
MMDAMVLIGCPVCGRRYRYDTARFGTRGVRLRCRSCEAVMKIDLAAGEELMPTPVSSTDPPAASPESRPAATPPAPPPAVVVEAAADEAGDPSLGILDPEAEMRLEETFGPGPEPRPVALVADRDADMRALLAGVLASRGYQVHTVADGLDARRTLAVPGLEVAFLNAYLPQVLGVTLCAEIKRHPELTAMQVVLVGSLYRRDRFVRDPHELYGADFFLDGNGSGAEVRRRADELCAGLRHQPPAPLPAAADARGELMRLARIVAGDIIIYNAGTAEAEIASGRFFVTFAQEVQEGEALVAHRFADVSDHRSLYLETLKEAVEHHGVAAGIPVRTGH